MRHLSSNDYTMATEASSSSFMQGKERRDQLQLDQIIIEEDEDDIGLNS